MPVNYYSIQDSLIDEIVIKKSRFITYLHPIRSEEEFNQHLSQIRKEHYKATHHCQAFILNDDSSIQRMSDDGEPSGTAGLPMLEVLKQNNLTYIMAVTVRYFGGIKLGAGGLIRAYSSSVSEAVDKAQIIKNVTQQKIQVILDYSQIDLFNYSLKETDLAIDLLDTTYTDKVTYDLSIDVDILNQVKDLMNETFSGSFEWIQGPEHTIDIPI